MGIKFSNNSEGTLSGGINDVVTSLILNAGEGVDFPTVGAGATDYFYATLISQAGVREIIKVVTRVGDGFTVIERGADGSAAASFATNDKVQVRFPKIILEDFRDDIVTNASDLSDYETANNARVAIVESDLAGTTNAGTVPAASGTKMYFYQDAVPSTWTIDVGPADSLLGIKGGAQAFNAAGGTVVGTWTPTTHTHTGPSHVHTMNTHTHTGPSHTHTGPNHTHTGPFHNHVWSYNGLYTYNSAGTGVAFGAATTLSAANILVRKVLGGDGYYRNSESVYTNKAGTGATGAGGTGATGASGTAASGATDPGDTNASGTAATGTGSAPSTDRPKTAIGSMATKD